MQPADISARSEMVWLHGWGHTHQIFLPLARAFEQSGWNRLFDLPGFGQTPKLQDGAGSSDYAEALVNLLPSDCGQRVIVGHSFGCRVAVELAAKYPQLVDGLVLIAAAGIPKSRSILWKLRAGALKILGKLAGASDKIFRSSFKSAYQNRFGSDDYRNAGDLRSTFLAVINEDLTELARQISCPVLLIYGEQDLETPSEIGEKYRAALPNATLKILPGFGHLDILSNGRHRIEDLIRKFMTRLNDENRND